MVQIKVRKVGNSLGVILPKDAVQQLKVDEGDTLFLTETTGGYRLTLFDPEFEKTMKTAEGFMKRYRHALRELAK